MYLTNDAHTEKDIVRCRLVFFFLVSTERTAEDIKVSLTWYFDLKKPHFFKKVKYVGMDQIYPVIDTI